MSSHGTADSLASDDLPFDSSRYHKSSETGSACEADQYAVFPVKSELYVFNTSSCGDDNRTLHLSIVTIILHFLQYFRSRYHTILAKQEWSRSNTYPSAVYEVGYDLLAYRSLIRSCIHKVQAFASISIPSNSLP